MDIFDVLSLIGGLSLFLFGMNVMGQALERRAGNKLRTLLGRLTTNRMSGFLTGLGVTAVIQSSSATTVMVVGFVNSGLMTLSQAINVIMGDNVIMMVAVCRSVFHAESPAFPNTLIAVSLSVSDRRSNCSGFRIFPVSVFSMGKLISNIKMLLTMAQLLC